MIRQLYNEIFHVEMSIGDGKMSHTDQLDLSIVRVHVYLCME